MIGKLLVSRSGLVERNAVEVFSSLWCSLVLFILGADFQLVGRAMLLWRQYGRIQEALCMID